MYNLYNKCVAVGLNPVAIKTDCVVVSDSVYVDVIVDDAEVVPDVVAVVVNTQLRNAPCW